MNTVTISLPESLKAFVEKQVATKGFGNVSEYFRTLLRDAQDRDSEGRLEALLLQGLTSGEVKTVDKGFWMALRGEAKRLVAEHDAAKKKK